MGVASHLKIRIAEYDDRIRTFIPAYEEMLDRAVEALQNLARPRPTLVDLGTGTGALAARCLEEVGGGRLLGIDADPEMLDVARKRLSASAGKRVLLRQGDFTKARLGRCDAVVASLALHHVPTSRRKVALYRRVYRALRPGGVLLNADCCLSRQSKVKDALMDRWRAHLRARYSAPETARFFRAWAQEDTYFPLEDELAMMRAAGLAADVWWREGAFAVLVGSRP
jgi:ubiquinone/menaquinone biosynthesis C-methylase UbiE